jgi:hypothetical protein
MVRFLDQKSQFGYILEDVAMENVVIYPGHWEFVYEHWIYFMGIWQFCSYFPPIWYIVPQNLATLVETGTGKS